MKACSFVAVAFAVLSIALLATAVALPSWYVVKVGSGEIKFGLFQTCANDECSSSEYDDNSQCPDRSGSGLGTRINATVGLMIASMIMSVVAAAMAVLGLGSQKLGAVSLLFSVLAATTAGCGAALFVYTLENWYFCDKTYCEWSGFPDCENGFGTAFYLAAAGVACAIGEFVSQLVAVVTADPEQEPESAQVSSNEPVAQQADEGYTGDAPAPPDGDWVYDDSCGLYWSDSEYLYLDTTTNQYYDPKSGQWYDPESQRWYFRD
jgi:hypothetical protein